MRPTELRGVSGLRRIALAAFATAVFTTVLALAPAPASASPVIVRDDLTGMRFFNPCAGEDMTITDGTLQFVTNMSRDASGGFHVQVRGNAQGVVATGDVSGDNRHGEAVVLTCSNSDEAIRALLAAYPDARDIEITGAGLEEAFMRLTVGDVAGDELAPREGTRS